MSPWMLFMLASSPKLTSQTFTNSQTVIIPVGVSNLETVSGKGQDGTPATIGNASTYVDVVTGQSLGTGANSGALTWPDFQSDAQAIVNAINGGSTSGSISGVIYTGYTSTTTYDISIQSALYNNAIPGTAFTSYSAGWKSSGAIMAGDNGTSYVNYQYNIAATTGTNATGFGKTFSGGVGGPASTTNFTNVAVTPGGSYPIVVPSGGSITITYYQ